MPVVGAAVRRGMKSIAVHWTKTYRITTFLGFCVLVFFVSLFVRISLCFSQAKKRPAAAMLKKPAAKATRVEDEESDQDWQQTFLTKLSNVCACVGI